MFSPRPGLVRLFPLQDLPLQRLASPFVGTLLGLLMLAKLMDGSLYLSAKDLMNDHDTHQYDTPMTRFQSRPFASMRRVAFQSPRGHVSDLLRT